MNSIESLKLDFNSLIKQLYNIHNKKPFDVCIYLGSGDSYVAGLMVEYLPSHNWCYSPSDLLNSRFKDNKTYCFISVTSKIKANIGTARRVNQAGLKTVAITFNKNSKLAEVCREVVPLEITKIVTPNAGLSSFVANVVTCLQIVGITVPKKYDIWQRKMYNYQ